MITLDALASDFESLAHFTPTGKERKKLASLGVAMPDGSFYIRNRNDLSNAINAVGRATPNANESEVTRRNAVRRHCMKRAKALGLMTMIPDTWNADGSLKQSAVADPIDAYLEHFGVKGMRWGVRREKDSSGRRPPINSEAARAAEIHTQVRKYGTSTVSNKDLQALVTRLNLERQYSNLDQKQVSSGRKYIASTLKNVGQQQAQSFANQYANKGAAWVLKKVGKKGTAIAAGLATRAVLATL